MHQQLGMDEIFRIQMMDGTLPYNIPRTQVAHKEVVGTGCSNTPLECRQPETLIYSGVSPVVDCLTFLWDGGDIRRAIVSMFDIWGVQFDEREIREDYKYNQQWYTLQGSWGCRMDYRFCLSGETRFRVTITGERCSSYTLHDIIPALRSCSSLTGFTCSRVDVNADDTTGTLCLSSIKELAASGGYAKYSVATCIESFGGSRSGASIIFGGDKSLQKVVFYDKTAESGGAIEGIRQELRMRGAKAHAAFLQMADCTGELLSEIIRGWLSNCILLGERRGAHLDRFKLADFWVNWVALLGNPTTRPPKVTAKSSVLRSLKWLERAASKALSVAKVVFTEIQFDAFVARMLHEGAKNIGEHLIPEMIQFTEQRCYVEFSLICDTV